MDRRGFITKLLGATTALGLSVSVSKDVKAVEGS